MSEFKSLIPYLISDSSNSVHLREIYNKFKLDINKNEDLKDLFLNKLDEIREKAICSLTRSMCENFIEDLNDDEFRVQNIMSMPLQEEESLPVKAVIKNNVLTAFEKSPIYKVVRQHKPLTIRVLTPKCHPERSYYANDLCRVCYYEDSDYSYYRGASK
jgi:hypothetical protein